MDNTAVLEESTMNENKSNFWPRVAYACGTFGHDVFYAMLGTYFMKVCINQTLKFLGKNSKTMPLFDDRRITNSDFVRDDKIAELYGACIDVEEEEKKTRMELLVNNIIASMTETCKNILHGYYWDDFSTSTIADMFNFSDANSVKAQKYKCVKKFRDKYNELKNKIYG